MSVSVVLGRASLRQDTISILHDAKRNPMTSECLNPELIETTSATSELNCKLSKALFLSKKGPTVWALIIEPSSPERRPLGFDIAS